MPAVGEQLAEGLRCQQAGQLECAEAVYREILRRDPAHADALHLLGLVSHQQGSHTAAKNSILQAIGHDGTQAAYHNNLGTVYQSLGDYVKAVASYRQSLQLDPRQANAHNNLGNALLALKRSEEAVQHFHCALELNPTYSLAAYNLGLAEQQRGNWSAAEAAYRRTLSNDQNHAQAHNNLAHVLMLQGRLSAAIEEFCSAVYAAPNYLEAWINLALAYQQDREFTAAEAAFRRALSIEGRNVTACCGLGIVLCELGDALQGLEYLERAVRLAPHDGQAQLQLGNFYLEQRRFAEAGECFERAITAEQTLLDAHNNLGIVCKERGMLEEAVGHFRRALEIDPRYSTARSNLLQALNYLPGVEPTALYEEHLRFGQVHERPIRIDIPYPHDRRPDRRLKIGYVSPDFRQHSVAYFLEPILREHDRTKFEILCYAEVARSDQVTGEFQSLANGWRNTVGLSDRELAKIVREDQVDILVDLAGHTSGHRLHVFAEKPAPVQVSYLGYGSTTGLRSIDYRLTDDVADPRCETSDYTEELIRLSDGFCCYQPPAVAPPVAPPPVTARGYVTFGSFNHLSKMSPPVIEVYAQILRNLPQARLVLKNRAFHDPTNQQKFLGLFAAHGVSADRLELRGLTPTLIEHLEWYNQIDVALDTFPYTGATTSCEALWMGVPVVTLRGQSFVGRISSSLLTQVQLTELIAENTNDYQGIAQQLALDPVRLRSLRNTMRERIAMSPLGEASRFTRNLEQAYRTMWRRWCCDADQKIGKV